MKARVIIGTSESVRFAIADTTDIVKESAESNIYEESLNISSIALINIATVMSSDLKQKNSKLTISLKADGLLGKAKVKVKENGDIISSVFIDNKQLEEINNAKDLEEFRKLFTIGKGKVLFEKDMAMKTPYYTELNIDESLSIEEVFQKYYDVSEQVKTKIKTGIKFDENEKILKSGAIFIQVLPNANDEKVKQIFDKLKIIYGIQELLYHNFSLEDIAKLLFESIDNEENEGFIEEYKILEERTLLYRCDCSAEYFKNLIKLVHKKEEIEEIIEKEKYIEAVCGFCNTAYRFDEVE